MRSPLSLTSSWLLLVIISTIICITSTSFTLLTDAQSTSSIPNPTSSTPQPTTVPPPPSLPPGTRELHDGQVVADRIVQGQLQTYHFSIAQQQRLPVRRQLERIIFHPGLDKRQAPSTPTSTPSLGPGSPPPTTTTPAAPTRTIAPTIPEPFANGTYAVFISISTCSTPKSGSEGICPPLVLYVSTSAGLPLPGPGQEPKGVQVVTGQDGLIQFTAYTTRDLFFSLQPPSLQGYIGDWAVEVGASSQGMFF
ncbi:hypothetical protein BGZ92_004749 [Podila epicladia]|nr:hypothetical protein BGZ92_004749 [Podila epicladia]